MDDRGVPYIVHESILARTERTIKRLWILIIILVIALLGTNIAWLYYESQWETVVVTQETAADRNGTAIIYDGVHINGESEAND